MMSRKSQRKPSLFSYKTSASLSYGLVIEILYHILGLITRQCIRQVPPNSQRFATKLWHWHSQTHYLRFMNCKHLLSRDKNALLRPKDAYQQSNSNHTNNYFISQIGNVVVKDHRPQQVKTNEKCSVEISVSPKRRILFRL